MISLEKPQFDGRLDHISPDMSEGHKLDVKIGELENSEHFHVRPKAGKQIRSSLITTTSLQNDLTLLVCVARSTKT